MVLRPSLPSIRLWRTFLASLLGLTPLRPWAQPAAAPSEVALRDAFSSAPAQRMGWALLSGSAPGASDETQIRLPRDFVPVDPTTAAGNVRWQLSSDHITAEPASDERFAVAAYTVQAGGAGFYALTDSSLRRASAPSGDIELRVFVRHAALTADQQPVPAVFATVAAGEFFDFDTFLGYLDAGDTVYVAVGPNGDPSGDRTAIDFKLSRVPAIPVSLFPADFSPEGSSALQANWWWSSDVAAELPAARLLAWRREPSSPPVATATSARLPLPPRSADHPRSVAGAFRVPQSGYYALHDTWLSSAGAATEARVFVGQETSPRRTLQLIPSARTSLNLDLGYIARGDAIYLALANTSTSSNATVELGGSIVEWAPRRPPLRVRRGTDGFLDVIEPTAPRTAVDIPPANWITVDPMAGDATAAIRAAFTAAQEKSRQGGYAGIRLARDATYLIAPQQTGGAILALRDAQRLVFDGNGATLRITSTEIARREVSLFSLGSSRLIAFADFTVEAVTVPFTTGEVLGATPPGANTQTVSLRVEPAALDPLREISRDGRADMFLYDPLVPGRIALGAWTHYPGRGDPSLVATDTPAVYTHTVTRTNGSITPGAKWLIKNKRGGVIYLSARAGTEDVTLSGVIGKAAGGGHLRFSPASGMNILDCRFEPEGDNWISSSADSIHGRGREGVWIENTLIRGICEDIMNTYGQSMVVLADDNPDDAVMTIRMFEGSVESKSPPTTRAPNAENVIPGDQLVFFNPKNGRVLGYALVRSIANGRFTLSNPVPGIDPWDASKRASATMVYNTRVAGRFFVRDSRFMDSMRIGIYIKARGGVVFHSQFEGLSSSAIFAVNEPEWPEGPPATHLWVQGCSFSQNNYGYMPRHRAFLSVDPADISIYTRRLRDPAEPAGYRANLTTDQYANSHMRLVGNVFHDWRGMGIAVRNSRNVRVEDNLFLAPLEDGILRATLATDPVLRGSNSGRGAYAAIFLDSVAGVRVAGNRFENLSPGDLGIARGNDVSGYVARENRAASAGDGASVALSFSEWFGGASREAPSAGRAVDVVALGGATHRAGRWDAGLYFSGGSPATLAPSADFGQIARERFTLALWACADTPAAGAAPEIVFAQGDTHHGLVLAVDRGRWRAGVWRDDQGAWLDLGAVRFGDWQHLALSLDGGTALTGYVDGCEVGAETHHVPATLEAGLGPATLGGVARPVRLDRDRSVPPAQGAFHGTVDEFRFYDRVLAAAEIAVLALRPTR